MLTVCLLPRHAHGQEYLVLVCQACVGLFAHSFIHLSHTMLSLGMRAYQAFVDAASG